MKLLLLFNMGGTEIFLIFFVLLGIPTFFFWAGYKYGFNKGRLREKGDA